MAGRVRFDAYGVRIPGHLSIVQVLHLMDCVGEEVDQNWVVVIAYTQARHIHVVVDL